MGGVRYDPGGAGPLPVTSFADTFNRVDEPPFLGTQWNMQISTATNLAGVTIDGLVNVGAGVCSFGLPASGGLVNSTFTPAYVDRSAVKTATAAGGRSQFSQIRMRILGAGISCAIGPMVYQPNPNDGNCYILICNNLNQLQLFRRIDAAAVILNAAVGVWAVNDVIRLECTAAAGANTLRSFKNGVLQATDVDNAGGRPQGGGQFGLAYFSSNAAGGQLSFDNYSGGLI